MKSSTTLKKLTTRIRRHARVRSKVYGTALRPRLSVFRSNRGIFAQIIDDEKAQTIAAASTTEKALGVSKGGNVEAARKVGKAIAERALAVGINHVVFDRGGYLYHGRVRALTDAARAAGLNKGEAVEAEGTVVEEAKVETASKPETKAKGGKRKTAKEQSPKEE